MGRLHIKIERFQMHSKMEFRLIIERRAMVRVTTVLQRPDDCIPPSYKVEMIFQGNGVIEPNVVVLQDAVMKKTRGKSDYLVFPPPDQKPRAITHALTELTEVRSI